MEPSKFIIGMIDSIQDKFKNDALRICLEVERQLIQGLADELKDPHLKFQDKFQVIADLKYCSDYVEGMLDLLHTVMNSDDPFYELLSYVEEE